MTNEEAFESTLGELDYAQEQLRVLRDKLRDAERSGRGASDVFALDEWVTRASARAWECSRYGSGWRCLLRQGGAVVHWACGTGPGAARARVVADIRSNSLPLCPEPTK